MGVPSVNSRIMGWLGASMGLGVLVGCGMIFNGAFLNSLNPGEVYPLTPGPRAAFVFVRVLDSVPDDPDVEGITGIEFVVTAEKTVVSRDDDGNPIYDTDGKVVTEIQLETVRLQTRSQKLANENGHAFACSEEAIERVGLGENLLPTDSGAFINSGTQQIAGFGIPASVAPLSRTEGDVFSCGDTIIFRAIGASSVPGGVQIESFLLPYSNQPGNFSGPDTFGNLEDVIDQLNSRENP